MRARSLLRIVALVATAACASGGSTPAVRHVASMRSPLSGVEARSARVVDAYEAVQRLRPGFLRSRGSSGPGGGGVRVYIDGQPAGGLDMLRTVPAAVIGQIEYLSASEATVRWGARFREGVIHVQTGS
ncbi:MAG TPA: hypothetical protein VNA89_04865 [Gemmatimonadaceae bacterium]|nr:hypothetical protein [Gemmatimonadaceae bacterium]